LAPEATLVLPFGRPDAATERIVTAHRARPVDAVVAADDDGVLLAAQARRALGLPGNPAEAVAAARDKRVFRDVLRAAGLPGPWFRAFPLAEGPERAAALVPYPCVLKPLFLSASQGVIRADDPRAFAAAWRRIAAILALPDVRERGGEQADWLLVEGFIPGAEAALEGILVDGEFRLLAFLDKPDPLDGPVFEETLFVTPSRHPPAAQAAAAELVARAARALGLRTGPLHAEVRLGPGGPVPVEIAPRPIGGHCARILRFGAGISLEELILRQALALAPLPLEREARAAGVMMIPIPKAGRLVAVSGVEAARAVPGVLDVEISIPLTQAVVPLPEGHRYLGFIFAKDATPRAVEASLREAHRRLRFDIR
jgi:biotin carboxylase